MRFSMMVKLIVNDIHKPILCTYGRHNVHLHCLGFHFLISDLNISTTFRYLSSSGTIFHTLDAKYCKGFKPK